jgi:PAS domain S-box-containing protein
MWKILVIDDDEDDFFIVKEMLKEARGRKFDVQWAATFEAGREALQANHFNAVLIDYDLGPHTGIELIREANAWEYAAPLILFTGRGSYEVDVEAMQAGATLYLTKGEVNPLLLERGIRYAIDLKHKETELRLSKDRLEQELDERRRAEELLAFQASLLDNIHDAIIANDAEQRITAWNKAAEKLYGYTADEALGKIHGDLLRSEMSYEQRTSLLQQLREKDEYALEVVQYTKNGQRLIVEGRTIPRRDSDGNITGYVTTNRDITERKKLEDALQQREALLEAFFANSPSILNIVNEELRYLKTGNLTPSFFGLDRQTIVGKAIKDLAPEFFDNLEPVMKRVIDTGQPEQREVQFPVYGRSGVKTSWQASFFPIPLPEGKTGVGIIGVEITAQKKAE